jgi:hypothetical protein
MRSFAISTLKMETEEMYETLFFSSTLTRLIALILSSWKLQILQK